MQPHPVQGSIWSPPDRKSDTLSALSRHGRHRKMHGCQMPTGILISCFSVAVEAVKLGGVTYVLFVNVLI